MNWEEWYAVSERPEYWRGYDEPGLSGVEHVGDLVLRVWFDDTPQPTAYEIDWAPLFVDQNPGGVFAPLRDPGRFSTAYADYALVWPNPDTGEYDSASVDLAPECVRYYCERYGRPLTPTTRPLLKRLATEFTV